jgi:hypothetical protein
VHLGSAAAGLTRGLIELIVLNIGLDLGILSPTPFAMMVLMALGTTLATTPILQRLMPTERIEPAATGQAHPTAWTKVGESAPGGSTGSNPLPIITDSSRIQQTPGS